MKIKICGMKYADNLYAVDQLDIDYTGYIFFNESKRLMTQSLLPKDLCNIRSKKTGVFVNESIRQIQSAIQQYDLNCVQLHGDESPDMCARIKDQEIELIKVFSMYDDFNFHQLKNYEGKADHFLFDTKGKQRGGNGISFNWKILEQYDQRTSFFISGGIGPDNIDNVMQLRNLNIHGVDVNSGVETSPGLKDLDKLKTVIDHIRNYKTTI